jgi:hypothetical protein
LCGILSSLNSPVMNNSSSEQIGNTSPAIIAYHVLLPLN